MTDPIAPEAPEFAPEVLKQFDAVRRLGICNMMARQSVYEVACDFGYDDLALVATDKRAWPRLLVAYKREAGDV